MKKILVIVIMSIFLHGCATAPPASVQSSLIKQGNIKIGMTYDNLLQILGGSGAITVNFPLYLDENLKHKYLIAGPHFWGGYYHDTKFYEFKNENPPEASFWTGVNTDGYRLTKIWDEFLPLVDYLIEISETDKSKNSLVQVKSNALKYYANTGKTITTTNTSKDINFTIDDKKKQCEAIGFATATEKFADCVLRLVELDVKTQQSNQIALAQSQGNLQVAEQLKKQRNDQSSQYFLDLGEKLLNPQSTVSAPSTSTCRVTGGVYKTVSCW
jgi:hypothetical protein